MQKIHFIAGYGFAGTLGASKPKQQTEAESKVQTALNQRGQRRKYLKQIKIVLEFIRSNYGENNLRCVRKEELSPNPQAKGGMYRSGGGLDVEPPVRLKKKKEDSAESLNRFLMGKDDD